MFIVLCSYCLQQWDLVVILWRETYCFGNSLGCLKIPLGPQWPTTQLDATLSLYWKLHLVTRDVKTKKKITIVLETLWFLKSFQKILIRCHADNGRLRFTLMHKGYQKKEDFCVFQLCHSEIILKVTTTSVLTSEVMNTQAIISIFRPVMWWNTYHWTNIFHLLKHKIWA